MFQWQVTSGENGMSALAWLRRRLPGAPPGYLRRLLVQGRIKRAEKTVSPDDSLKEGDQLSLPESERLKQFFRECPPFPAILLETTHFLAVDKPSGLSVHRGADPREDNLTDRLRAFLKQRKDVYCVAPVHRLDRATSGPVLFGKGRQDKGRLGRLFMENAVEKKYLALVAGKVPPAGTWAGPVRAKGKTKEAETLFRTLGTSGELSLVEARPVTGRTHQIRQHSAAAGHPLAGDSRYGGPAVPELHRMFLHCLEMVFTDPWSGEFRRIQASLPNDLKKVLSGLGLDFPDRMNVREMGTETSIRPKVADP